VTHDLEFKDSRNTAQSKHVQNKSYAANTFSRQNHKKRTRPDINRS